MKNETTRLQLLFVFFLGTAVFTFSLVKDVIFQGHTEEVISNPWTLSWENNQLQLTTGESGQQDSVLKTFAPAAVRPVLFQPIPINHASAELLVSISGIGPVLAQRIIVQRETTGYYESYMDLVAVRGIGEKTAMKIAEHVSFER